VNIRVIGVGTRHGDDAAGLAVARRLSEAALPAGVSVVGCERPALDLVDDMAGVDALVLVDAMRSGRAAGTVCRIPESELRPSRGFSSHGIGISEALELATALGRAPSRVEIVGIEDGGAAEAELSPAVARGVEVAVAHVETLLGDLCDDLRRGARAHA